MSDGSFVTLPIASNICAQLTYDESSDNPTIDTLLDRIDGVQEEVTELSSQVSDVQSQVTELSSQMGTQPSNIIISDIPTPNGCSCSYVVAYHIISKFNLVKLCSKDLGNTCFSFRVMIISNSGNGNAFSIYDIKCISYYLNTTGTVCIHNDNNFTKLYKNENGLYLYYDRTGDSGNKHLIVTGLISNVNDIQFTDDTPENLG